MYARKPFAEVQTATSRTPTRPHTRVTARMLELRALIESGEFPDRDELAARIADKL